MIIIDHNELIEVTTLFHLGTAHHNRYDFSLPLLCYLSLTLMFKKLAQHYLFLSDEVKLYRVTMLDTPVAIQTLNLSYIRPGW